MLYTCLNTNASMHLLTHNKLWSGSENKILFLYPLALKERHGLALPANLITASLPHTTFDFKTTVIPR